MATSPFGYIRHAPTCSCLSFSAPAVFVDRASHDRSGTDDGAFGHVKEVFGPTPMAYAAAT